MNDLSLYLIQQMFVDNVIKMTHNDFNIKYITEKFYTVLYVKTGFVNFHVLVER